MEIIPSSLPDGGWSTPQGLSVFLLSAVVAFAVVGFAIARWWAPVFENRCRRRQERFTPRVVVAHVPWAPRDDADMTAAVTAMPTAARARDEAETRDSSRAESTARPIWKVVTR